MSAAPKFTPGPWHFADAEYAALGIARAEDGVYRPAASMAGAIVGPAQFDRGWHYVCAMNNHAEAAADARLIAASPELYEALLDMVNKFERGGYGDAPCPFVVNARAALAKVTP